MTRPDDEAPDDAAPDDAASVPPVGRRSRSEMRSVVLAVAVGAGGLLLSSTRPWLTATEQRPAPLPSRDVVLGAADLGGVRALGVVALLGAVAVIASRGWGRPVVGVLLLLTGVGAVLAAGSVITAPDLAAAGADVAAEPTVREGPWIAVLGGLVVTVAGTLVAVRGRRWSSMSRRYDAPAARADAAPTAEPVDRELWEALDRGEDPTDR